MAATVGDNSAENTPSARTAHARGAVGWAWLRRGHRRASRKSSARDYTFGHCRTTPAATRHAIC
jgi:hypothetical protein